MEKWQLLDMFDIIDAYGYIDEFEDLDVEIAFANLDEFDYE